MLGISRWQLLKALAAIVGIVGTVSLALLYFIPAPPSKVTMATGVRGSSFEYYGRQYREILARSNIELELRESPGAVENVNLLQDPKSGIQIALVLGGVSNGKHAPGLLSLGTVYNNPFWLFYSSNEPIERLSQLKGKRVAVGPVGSATRAQAEQILGKAGVNSESATLLPFLGLAAVDAMNRTGPGCLNGISARISGGSAGLSRHADWRRVEVGLIRGAAVKTRMRTAAVVEVEITAD